MQCKNKDCRDGRLIFTFVAKKYNKRFSHDAANVILCFKVFQLVCHLVFWAKLTIIYPLCETNVYILSPHADTQV